MHLISFSCFVFGYYCLQLEKLEIEPQLEVEHPFTDPNATVQARQVRMLCYLLSTLVVCEPGLRWLCLACREPCTLPTSAKWAAQLHLRLR
jgi:hypothetical protein